MLWQAGSCPPYITIRSTGLQRCHVPCVGLTLPNLDVRTAILDLTRARRTASPPHRKKTPRETCNSGCPLADGATKRDICNDLTNITSYAGALVSARWPPFVFAGF
jgi:hypothetical protein